MLPTKGSGSQGRAGISVLPWEGPSHCSVLRNQKLHIKYSSGQRKIPVRETRQKPAISMSLDPEKVCLTSLNQTVFVVVVASARVCSNFMVFVSC